jgi:hypothetical protein
MPDDILTGFLNAEGEAQGRPVGVAVDRAGALLVADDVGNVIWRLTPDAETGAALHGAPSQGRAALALVQPTPVTAPEAAIYGRLCAVSTAVISRS